MPPFPAWANEKPSYFLVHLYVVEKVSDLFEKSLSF